MSESSQPYEKPKPLEVLSLPKDETELGNMGTSTILKCMVEIQRGYSGSFSELSFGERQKQYHLLLEEFDIRVENYQVPKKYSDVAKALMAGPPPYEENRMDEENEKAEKEYQKRFEAYKLVSDTDWWNATIAGILCGADLPEQKNIREERIKEAKKLIRQYFKFQAGLPEYWKNDESLGDNRE